MSLWQTISLKPSLAYLALSIPPRKYGSSVCDETKKFVHKGSMQIVCVVIVVNYLTNYLAVLWIWVEAVQGQNYDMACQPPEGEEALSCFL
jgi:hypothetical protein